MTREQWLAEKDRQLRARAEELKKRRRAAGITEQDDWERWHPGPWCQWRANRERLEKLYGPEEA